jgi:hypothetical protein
VIVGGESGIAIEWCLFVHKSRAAEGPGSGLDGLGRADKRDKWRPCTLSNRSLGSVMLAAAEDRGHGALSPKPHDERDSERQPAAKGRVDACRKAQLPIARRRL